MVNTAQPKAVMVACTNHEGLAKKKRGVLQDWGPYYNFVEKAESRAAVKSKMVTGDRRCPHHDHDTEVVQVTDKSPDFLAMIREGMESDKWE